MGIWDIWLGINSLRGISFRNPFVVDIEGGMLSREDFKTDLEPVSVSVVLTLKLRFLVYCFVLFLKILCCLYKNMFYSIKLCKESLISRNAPVTIFSHTLCYCYQQVAKIDKQMPRTRKEPVLSKLDSPLFTEVNVFHILFRSYALCRTKHVQEWTWKKEPHRKWRIKMQGKRIFTVITGRGNKQIGSDESNWRNNCTMLNQWQKKTKEMKWFLFSSFFW